jgi:carbon-monoxide dehydrogenase medium subunit
MYPAAFDYVVAHSVDETLAMLAAGDEDQKVLAGGQSLIPMMKLRLATPTKLVDINRVPGLDGVGVSNGHLTVGALTRHNDVVHSDLVKSENHTMAAAAPWIADPLVRNLGTVGGSLAHADPQGDWGSVMLACGAEVVATSSRRGERTIPVTELFVDLFTSALEPDELLTEVRVPRCTGPAGGTYLKLERKVGDYATVGVAVHLQLDGTGQINEAGIALTGVGSRNIKATEAEQVLTGQTPSDELFAEAGVLAAAAADPRTDVRGSAEYKRSVVSTFVRRGLSDAASQAAPR